MSFTVRRLADETKKKRKPFPWQKVLIGALTVGKPLLSLLDALRKRQQAAKKERERSMLLKRILVILVTVLCAAFVLNATVQAVFGLKLLSLRSIVSISAAELPKDSSGHTNILLLGKGDDAHDGIDLTDTMMVVSLDPTKTKSAVMLSIPRDLYLLKTQNMGKGRINTMYRDYKSTLIQSGKSHAEASKIAMQEVGQELGDALGIKIHKVALVDFIGFVQAVDAIGGVDIDVAQDLVDTQYPDTENSYTTFTVLAGRQHLDGETALKYARSRHSTSDFDRSRRQQQILKALADKVKTEHLLTKPNHVIELLGILKDHIDTTMTVREMVGLANLGLSIDPAHILSMQLNDRNGLYGSLVSPGGFLYTPPRAEFDGASVLLPISIPPDPITWKQIKVLTYIFVDTRSPVLARLPIDVLNAGAPTGSSKKLGGELARYGFIINGMANAENGVKNPSSVIVTNAQNKEVATYLGTLLHMEVQDADAATEMQGITILLGKDYTFTPLQSLIPKAQ